MPGPGDGAHPGPRPPAPARRAAALAELKARKVAASVHAFVRASTDLFYAEVGRLPRGALPAGPELWICGDCHSENLGTVAGAGEGDAPAIELNDFDETVLGQPALDVLRLALALAVHGRSEGLAGGDVLALGRAACAGYAGALAHSAEAPLTPPERYRRALAQAAHQTHRALLDERTAGKAGARRFLLGPRYWPLAPDERRELAGLVPRIADASDGVPALVDAAFRMAGTGSLGCFRAAALVRQGGDHERALSILDVKEALPSRAPRSHATPADDAARIVAGARALTPALGARMSAARLPGAFRDARLLPGPGGVGVVVRRLRPAEQKVFLDGLAPGEALLVARFLGAVVGRAHRRQLDGTASRAWRREVVATDWLARVLPPLVGAHEAGYLAWLAGG